MVGPGDPGVHLKLAEDLARRLTEPVRGLDLGSGAGIPGLALAGLWPDTVWVLVDAAQRRVLLMQETVAELGWQDRVTVRHGRAEDLARTTLRASFDLVTARSFGPPATTAECAVGFLALGGVLAVTEPPSSDGSRWPEAELGRLGLEPMPAEPGLQRMQLTVPLDDRYPRRAGVPARKPLF